jgi:hypothetical protein
MTLEPVAPGMVGRTRLRVRPQEMVQDVQQGQHMRPIAAQLGLPNIIHDYVSNLFASALCDIMYIASPMEAISGRFVLGNGEYLLFTTDWISRASAGMVSPSAMRMMSPGTSSAAATLCRRPMTFA